MTQPVSSSQVGNSGRNKHALANRHQQRAARRKLFPEKLWDLVNKPDSGIRWSPDGKKIHVDRGQLEKFIGTKFRSHNFDSFIRQLHFYGFRKCGDSYHHDKFQRNQPDALLTMKRKYSNLNLQQTNTPSSSQQADPINITTNSIQSVESHVHQSPKPAHTTNRARLATSRPIPTSHHSLPSVGKKICTQLVPYIPANSQQNHNSLSLLPKYKTERVPNEISIYTFLDNSDSFSSFTNIPQSFLAKAYSENTSICISIPEALNDNKNVVWPKTLVLENCWNGMDNVLSAHFIYPTE